MDAGRDLMVDTVLDGVVAIDSAALGAVRPVAAMDAIMVALRDPASLSMPARTVHPTAFGELFLMPASVGPDIGIKVLGLARGNPAKGLPAIQGVHLVLDALTMTPLAVLDGAALTELRTPAVALAATRERLNVLGRPLHAVVYGTGAQGRGHVRAIRDVAASGLASLTVVSRRSDPIRGATVVAPGSMAEADALGRADLIACATSSTTPVLDAGALPDRLTIVAVGTHEPGSRELPGVAFAGATVIIEERETALREAGDVILAIDEGFVDPAALIELGDVARGYVDLIEPDRVIIKTTGLAWQDVVVARVVLDSVGVARPALP